MNLTQAQKQEAKELLSKLENLYNHRAGLDILKINREDTLREEIASICDIRNKQGEIQPNKVKMPLLLALIDEIFFDKTNKKEEEYALMGSYRQALSGKDVNKDTINAYVALQEEIEENNQNLKEVFKETNTLDKEILDAINLIAKEKYKEILNSKKLEAGMEVKEPKDMSAILTLIKELESILK